MFAPERLRKLSPAHRLRKTALLLTDCVRAELLEARGGRLEEAHSAYARAVALAVALAALSETPPDIRELATAVSEAGGQSPADRLRLVDALRHELWKRGGQDRADWDLLDPETGLPPALRATLPRHKAYLEDIRSPFNVGSMFRSAEAFGLEALLLSPACADPGHPRARRSAMGADELLPWRRAGLEALETEGPAFALELGGEGIEDFVFPEGGIVVVGSEELGVSRQALERCSLGMVSIPLRGAKASLNAGVAFGIVLAAWASRHSPKAPRDQRAPIAHEDGPPKEL